MKDSKNFGSKKDSSNKSGAKKEREKQRHDDAVKRQLAYEALTLEERLDKALLSPGKSFKEIARLEGQIVTRDLDAKIQANKATKKEKKAS